MDNYDKIKVTIKQKLDEDSVVQNFHFALKPIHITNKAPSTSDEAERLLLLNMSDALIDKLQKDLFTRQACISLNYANSNFTQCPSLMHAYLDLKTMKLCLNVYMRSWHFEKNFDYDITTFSMILEKIAFCVNTQHEKICFYAHNIHNEKGYKTKS